MVLFRWIKLLVGFLACTNGLAQRPEYLYSIPLDGSAAGLHAYAPMLHEGDGFVPAEVSVNRRGELAILDYVTFKGARAMIYGVTGRLLRILSADTPGNPVSVDLSCPALRDDGRLFAMESEHHPILLHPDGTHLDIGAKGKSAGSRLNRDVWRIGTADSLVCSFEGLEDGFAQIMVEPTSGGLWYATVWHRPPATMEMWRHGPGRVMLVGADGAVRLATISPVWHGVADQALPVAYPDERGAFLTTTWRKSRYFHALQLGNRLNYDRILTRYSEHGVPCAQVTLPSTPGGGRGPGLCVSPNGDLYCLVYGRDRVHVLRIPLSTVNEGFLALEVLPTLAWKGRTFVPLLAAGRAAGRAVAWNAKAKVASVGKRVLAVGSDLHLIHGSGWVTRAGAQRLGLDLNWHPKGVLAYGLRR